ncbi:MAG: hypothetical protein ACO3RV_02665, partial [Luteolibacter sp.]
NRRTGELVTAENFQAPENCRHLYRHFAENGRIRALQCGDPTLLAHTGRDIHRMILAGDEQWRNLVPESAWPMAGNIATSSQASAAPDGGKN